MSDEEDKVYWLSVVTFDGVSHALLVHAKDTLDACRRMSELGITGCVDAAFTASEEQAKEIEPGDMDRLLSLGEVRKYGGCTVGEIEDADAAGVN